MGVRLLACLACLHVVSGLTAHEAYTVDALAKLVSTHPSGNSSLRCDDPRAANYGPTGAGERNNSTCQYNVCRAAGDHAWVTTAAYCKTAGFTEHEIPKCYRELLRWTPPWERPLETLHERCVPSASCVTPFTIDFKSAGFTGFVFDSQSQEVTLSFDFSLSFKDLRLYGTKVVDPEDVWKPSVTLDVFTVGDKHRRMLDISAVGNPLQGLQYDPSLKTFVPHKSSVRCGEIAHCHTSIRGSLTKLIQLRKMDYTKFPFDHHTFQIVASVGSPYSYLAHSSEHDKNESGYSKLANEHHIVDWHSQGHEKYENSDGSTVLMPVSVVQSLKSLGVTGYNAQYDLTYTADGNGIILTLNLDRQYSSVFSRFIFPMVLIVTIATNAAWLGPAAVGPRNIVCVIGILTAVHMADGAAKVGPASSTATWFDYLVVIVIFSSFVAIVFNFVSADLHTRQRMHDAVFVDKVARLVAPLFFIVLLIIASVSIFLEGGALIGAVIGCVIGAALLVALRVFFVLKQRKRAVDKEAADKAAERALKSACPTPRSPRNPVSDSDEDYDSDESTEPYAFLRPAQSSPNHKMLRVQRLKETITSLCVEKFQNMDQAFEFFDKMTNEEHSADVVTAKELRLGVESFGFQTTDAEVQWLLLEADEDGNSVLSRAEFVEYFSPKR